MKDTPLQIIEDELLWLCSRPKSQAKICGLTFQELRARPDRWTMALTRAEQINLRAYLAAPGVDERWAFCLNQSWDKGFGSRSNGVHLLPTLIRNAGVIWANGRSLTPHEMLKAQQMPVERMLAHPGSHSDRSDPFKDGWRCCSFTPGPDVAPPKSRSRNAMAGQAGNGMNTAVCHGIWYHGCHGWLPFL